MKGQLTRLSDQREAAPLQTHYCPTVSSSVSYFYLSNLLYSLSLSPSPCFCSLFLFLCPFSLFPLSLPLFLHPYLFLPIVILLVSLPLPPPSVGPRFLHPACLSDLSDLCVICKQSGDYRVFPR